MGEAAELHAMAIDDVNDRVRVAEAKLEAVRKALHELAEAKTEGISLKRQGIWGDGDPKVGATEIAESQEAPFFSEAFLYILFGKEDARTILHYVREVQKAAEAPMEEWV